MSNSLRLAGIIRESVVDGPGIRMVIFTQGCPHNCPGCHNPDTHNFEGGYTSSTDIIINEIKKNPLLSGITFSGGEPFCQADNLSLLGERIVQIKNGWGKSLDILAFSGYTFEELIQKSQNDIAVLNLLSVSRILIDGRFIESQKSLDLQWRGSKNQRVLDVKKSLQAGNAVEFK